jgi:hypothetical protein
MSVIQETCDSMRRGLLPVALITVSLAMGTPAPAPGAGLSCP